MSSDWGHNVEELPKWLFPESIEDLTTRVLMVLIIIGFITEKIVPGRRVERMDKAMEELTEGLKKSNDINERAMELLGERRTSKRK